VPSATCSWQDILDIRTELRDKLWTFRRFLRGLAVTTKTEPEIRDEIEWSLNEYQNSMKLHRLKTTRSALEQTRAHWAQNWAQRNEGDAPGIREIMSQMIGSPTGIKRTRNKPETQDSSKP
jgi:hypothetical protein